MSEPGAPAEARSTWAARFAESSSAFLVKHNVGCALAGLIVLIVCAFGLTRLDLVTDYRTFFQRGDADLAQGEWFARRLSGGSDTLILIYKPESGDVFDSISILQLARVAERAKQLPHVSQALSLFDQTKLVHIAGAERLGLSGPNAYRIAPILFPDGLLNPDALGKLRADVLSTPLIAGRYVARDGASAAILLTLDLDDASRPRAHQIEQIAQAADAIGRDLQRLNAGDRVFLVGPTLFDRASLRVLASNAEWLMPITLGVFMLIFIVLFGEITRGLFVMGLVLASMIASMGAAGFFGLDLTVLTFSGMMIVATLAVSDSLHVLTSQSVLDQTEPDRKKALYFAFRFNFWPMQVTSLTDVAGYAVLFVSTSPAVRDMGLVVTLGVILALFFTFAFTPFFALRMPVRKRAGVTVLPRLMTAAGNFVIRHRWPVAIVSTLAVAFCSVGIFRIEARDSMATWFGPRTEFRQGLDLLAAGYSSMQNFSVAVEARPEDAGAATRLPAIAPPLDRYAALNHDLEAIPNIRSWVTADIGRNAFDARIASAHGDTGFELDAATIASGGERIRPVTAGALSDATLMSPFNVGETLYTFRHADGGGASNGELVAAATASREAAHSAFPERDTRVGGLGLTFARLGDSNMHGVLSASIGSLAAIAIMLAFAFSSIRLAVIGALPNIAPLVLVFGIWGWTVGEVNLAAVTVISVAMGIIVDDTTHLMMKFNLGRLHGLGRDQAIIETVSETSPAVVSMTVVIAAGYFLLGFSDFTLTAQKANLVAATVTIAVFFDLLIMPALLSILAKDEKRPQPAASEPAASEVTTP